MLSLCLCGENEFKRNKDSCEILMNNVNFLSIFFPYLSFAPQCRLFTHFQKEIQCVPDKRKPGYSINFVVEKYEF